ncbi:hypothetical protein CSIRO_1171 [Bradyrhizobiaceae bacterium SG-6C]|nr:hypothetical protein CSIRO_1171 [Bradyrhizobiaceae bacterium SG-6C]
MDEAVRGHALIPTLSDAPPIGVRSPWGRVVWFGENARVALARTVMNGWTTGDSGRIH